MSSADRPIDSDVSAAELRAIVRDELETALQHQWERLFWAFVCFSGLQVVLLAFAAAGSVTAVVLGGLLVFFGVFTLYGQRPLDERRSERPAAETDGNPESDR